MGAEMTRLKKFRLKTIGTNNIHELSVIHGFYPPRYLATWDLYSNNGDGLGLVHYISDDADVPCSGAPQKDDEVPILL
jgi:hypothetical protein